MTETPEARDDALRRRVEEAVGSAFTIHEEIGRGGMAVVYRATDARLRRQVAIKVLPPDLAFRSDVRARFVREAQLAAQLTHPNIVPIFAVDDSGGVVWFAMGLVDGQPLAKMLADEPRPDVAFVRRVLRDVAAGLEYAHQHGVVHRDIKPDNILIERASGRAVVTDFGIARAAEGDVRLTATGVAVGTPAYMSPEQAMGDKVVDGRADVYSLGVVGWQMLAGELPFRAENTPGMLMKHISEPPRPLHQLRGDLPANLVYAIERAMAKGAGERWPTAAEFGDALGESAVAPDVPMSGISSSKPWRYNPLKEDARTDSGAHAIREWRAQRDAWRARRGVGGSLKLRLGEQIRDTIEEAARQRALERAGFAGMEHEPMSRRDLRRFQRAGIIAVTPEERIRRVQRSAISAVTGIGFFAVVNAVTSPHFPWFIFPSLALGISFVTRVGSLWVDGIPLRRLFQRQEVPEHAYGEVSGGGTAVVARGARSAPSSRPVAVDLTGVSAELLGGPYGASVREAAEARAIIGDVLGRLTPDEKLALPDVTGTAAQLEERIRALAAAKHQLDRDASPDAIARLERRIEETRASGGDSGERDRRVGLLERQLVTLKDLAERRDGVGAQLESATILLQTMKLDLLKLRSTGIETKLADSTMATQEARAVATDIERLVDAAAEVRKL